MMTPDPFAQERAIIDAIKRGLDDMEAGRMIPHADAMRRLQGAIARAPQITCATKKDS
jgi:predicted transcriptional regulator